MKECSHERTKMVGSCEWCKTCGAIREPASGWDVWQIPNSSIFRDPPSRGPTTKPFEESMLEREVRSTVAIANHDDRLGIGSRRED